MELSRKGFSCPENSLWFPSLSQYTSLIRLLKGFSGSSGEHLRAAEGWDITKHGNAGVRLGPSPCPHPVFKSICYCRVVSQTSPSHLKLLTHPGCNKYFLMESSKNCHQSYWKKCSKLTCLMEVKKPHQKLSAICGLLFLHKMYISYLFTSGVLGFIVKSDASTLALYKQRLIVGKSSLIQDFRYL